MRHLKNIMRGLWHPCRSHMSAAERIFRACVYLRWGADSTEADIITDYLDGARADYRGATRAWKAFAEEKEV